MATGDIRNEMDNIRKKISELERIFHTGLDTYKLNLKYEIDHILDRYEKPTLPVNMEDKQIKLSFLRHKKEAREHLLQDNRKLDIEIKDLAKEIFELERDLGLHIVPHQHAHEDKVTTVPIFECCKQAFKCF